jgi:peptide/nickel transport system permease protein
MTRKGRAALACVIAVHLLVLAAPWMAPYDPASQHRQTPFAPPTRLHFVDAHGLRHARPFVCAIAAAPGAVFQYVEDCARIFPVRLFVRRDSFAGFTTRSAIHLFGVDQPGDLFLLGTDEFGRDELSRVLVGARVSLLIALAATALSIAIGTLLGSIAGYLRGLIDTLVSATTELVFALPWLYLLLAVRAALPLSLPPAQAFVAIMLMLVALGWALPARLVRAMVATIRTQDYVAAATAAGATTPYVLRRHVAPGLPVVLVPIALQLLPQYVLAETTLSLFGLGMAEPIPSWGSMLADALRPQVLVHGWWLLAPVAGLIGICVMYYLTARTLRSVPHQQRL